MRITLILSLFILSSLLRAQDQGIRSYSYEGKKLIELVLDQRPAKLSDIKFGKGTLFSQNWEQAAFTLHSLHNDKSPALLKKTVNSKLIFSNDTTFCEFADSTKNKNCFDLFTRSDPYDPPISHSIKYFDLFIDTAVWYKIKLGELTGWVKTPFTYSDFYFKPSPEFLHSTLYTQWTPLKSVNYYQSLRSGKFALLEKIISSADNLTIIVHEEIFWKKDIPFLKVDIAKMLTKEEWCTQTKKPEVISTGYIRMFNDVGEMNVLQKLVPGCD